MEPTDKVKLLIGEIGTPDSEMYKQAFEALDYEVYACDKNAQELTAAVYQIKPDIGVRRLFGRR